MLHPTLWLAAALACAPLTFASQESFQPIPQGDHDGHEYRAEFFHGATYRANITKPEALLGQPLGSRLAKHEEIVSLFRLWAAESDRLIVGQHGRTYEGREMIYGIVTSPENQRELSSLQAANTRLADPRGLQDGEARQLMESTPAVAYLGYSIHGDETSGADASLALVYHLLASDSDEVRALLQDLILVIEPQMNPDGRARIVGMVEQNSGYRANLDIDSMARGRWPYGRGNHYLLDMNRDWMAGVAPETRARWDLLGQWLPQLFVDAHEMSGLDTFLMYPQNAPYHPALPQRLLHWQEVFAEAHGAAFDREGWGYYTREWADAWYPGYSDAWGAFQGAVGMLYEQGSNRGQPLRREGGEVVAYREAVHGQVVASWSNLNTLRENRVAIRKDQFEHRKRQLNPAEGSEQVVFMRPTRNGSRVGPLVRGLRRQGIEVFLARDVDRLQGVRWSDGRTAANLVATPDMVLIPLAQPQGALVRGYFELDPRIDADTLQDERDRLDRGEGSRLYDVTAWDLLRQYDLVGGWAACAAELRHPVPATYGVQAGGVNYPVGATGMAYAYAVEGQDDRLLRFAARAMERGLVLHVADEPFRPNVGAAERPRFSRGSLLLRLHENPRLEASPRWGETPVHTLVQELAVETGVTVQAVMGGRAASLDDPDLGGGHFALLARPKVALLSGPPLHQSFFGHTWQYLDEELRMPVTLVAAESFGGFDLRPYNVLVIPSGNMGDWLQEHWEGVRAWVRSGGTLIAMDHTASALAGESFGLGDVRRRADVLGELDAYREAARRWRQAGQTPLDLEQVWGDAPAVVAEEAEDDESTAVSAMERLDSDFERADRLAQRYMPTGAILRAHANPRSWLAYGVNETLPVPYEGATVLLSTGEVPVRLAPADSVRLAGLVWPEARERLADGAWLARERLGSGQVLLFPFNPVFRGSWKGTARLLGNAVVFGPGLGASPVRDR